MEESHKYLKEIEDVTGFATVKHLSSKQILAIPFPIPPLPEQHRIVALLDQAFEAIATARANTEQNLRNARELFDSQLEAVFSQRGEGWVESSLSQVTTKIGSGATPRGGESVYKTEGVSLIRSLNVHDLGFSYTKLAFLDDEQAAGLSNVTVQRNDVLLNITGASVARCCIAPDDVLPARVNQHVSIIRAVSNILNSEFLHYLLISKSYKNKLLQTGSKGGSTRQAITKSEIQNFKISYPASLAEQNLLVSKLDAAFSQIQHLESLCQRKLAALDELKQSLLQQAFSGKLVTNCHQLKLPDDR
ncbi:MAG: restriction endonuclease subunit S [Trichlorobacter sp.]|nr:restriction endonuclease subunit S [Trichlorobacter sp.]